MAERRGQSSSDGPAATPDREPGRKRYLTRHLTRHFHLARQVWQNPHSVGDIVRAGLIDVWCSRGGGFFGLGYLFAFVILELHVIVSEYESSSSVMEFVTEELIQYLLRLGLMSFVNVLLAFLWPVMLLEYLGGWGLVVLALGYLVFERALRPGIEASVPELAESRRRAEERKAAKRAKREARRRGKGS